MHARLLHRVLQEARVQAFKPPLLNPRRVGFRGGVVLEQQDDRLRHWRHGSPADGHDPAASYLGRLQGEFNYGGFVYHHFGHFMAEMVHRIVPSRLLRRENPFIFVGPARKARAASFEMPEVARHVLDLLGVQPGDYRIVTDNSLVETLLVVEQGSALGTGPKPGYLDDLRDYMTPRLDALHRGEARPDKIYVSRGRMRGGIFLGERYVEEQLQSEGFSIIHPETLPLSVQMDHYRKSEVLIFAEGSACHGVELLGTAALRRCYLLVRRHPPRKQFQALLEPRAAEFAASLGHPFIGTKYARPGTQEPVIRLGVNLFNPGKLARFFRDNNIARLPLFSEKAYFDAAEADLLNYQSGPLDSFLRRQDPGEMQKMMKRFRRVKDLVKT